MLEPQLDEAYGFMGSGGETRTPNKRINSPLLCQLSYPGKAGKITTAPAEPWMPLPFGQVPDDGRR